MGRGRPCSLKATVALFQVVGNGADRVVLPAGAFCDHHAMQEREIRRKRGEQTAVQTIEPPQLCCWEPL